MLTSEQRKEMIDKIKALPELLRSAIKGLSDEQLDTPYRQGGWTLRQVVHHLAESHMNCLIRFKFALTEKEPVIKSYDQDLWVHLPDTSGTSVENSLRLIEAVHARLYALFSALDDKTWQKMVIHQEYGTIMLDELLRIYSNHGENHVAQINGLRSDKGWQ